MHTCAIYTCHSPRHPIALRTLSQRSIIVKGGTRLATCPRSLPLSAFIPVLSTSLDMTHISRSGDLIGSCKLASDICGDSSEGECTIVPESLMACWDLWIVFLLYFSTKQWEVGEGCKYGQEKKQMFW